MTAYFIFHNRVHDEAGIGAYREKAGPTLAAYGGEIVVADANAQLVEGSSDYHRTVVVRFESRERAQAWYNSPEYQEVLAMRLAATEGFAVLVDGFELG